MVYKYFKWFLLVRISLIFLNLLVLVFVILYRNYFFIPLIFVAMLAVQLYFLIRSMEQTHIKMKQFLDAIRYSDFAVTFKSPYTDKSFVELDKSFNMVIKEFNKSRLDKEEQAGYLQTLVQHVSMGIVVFREDGKIDLVNNAFRKLFHLNQIHHISELKVVDADLAAILLNIKSEIHELFKLTVEGELLQLSIYSTEFKMKGDLFKLVSLQNIHYELEQKEMESWQKLTRVLTHEIMNSITPISSLASSVKSMLSDEDVSLEKELSDDVKQALNTIEKRSKGLLKFVDIYRDLTRIPKPNFSYFPIYDLFSRVEGLMKQQFKENEVAFEMKIFPAELMLLADIDLIEQVLINLLINALHAVKDVSNSQIKMLAEGIEGKVVIYVVDNGKGIKADMLEKIFIPFFTSKPEGSGIGLSLSRQIMFLHKGAITVSSNPGIETCFMLKF